MKELFYFLQNVQPIGVIALLGLIIYQQVKNQKGQNKIATNHLHGLPEMSDTLRRIEGTMNDVAKDISYIRGRINGHDS